mgnify:CR=1 FL=1
MSLNPIKGANMPEMLLINPRKRRAAKSTKRRASPRRARRAAPKRRRNPINTIAARVRRTPVRRAARRANPIRNRRRRNPISLGGSAKSYMSAVKDALIGAGGAIGVDLAFAKLSPMLPASLQVVKGSPGAGDAVKAVFTVIAGKLLSKATRGLSVKAAQGALTVQAHGIVSGLLPASMQVNGLGYYSPAQIASMTNRVGPIRRGMNAYVTPGQTQLLNAYAAPGRTQLLNSSPRVREGVTIR